MDAIERVFPFEVHGVFKVGNVAGEYTICSSSPHTPIEKHLAKGYRTHRT
jgi:hypothetical protein